jgi:type IV pilus assembly protein PilM
VLREEIKTALRAKQTGNLLPKVDRFLSLNPGDQQATQLAQKLTQHHCQSAKRRLVQHRYEEALALLRQVPSGFRTAEIEQLLERAAELNELMVELQTAVYADTTLLAVARRLLKLDPGNPETRELCRKLKQHANGRPRSAQYPWPVWCEAPDQTHVGVPVDSLFGFQSLADGPVCQLPAYREDPARFSVALGLALQGLEKVPLRTNLMPREKAGLRDRLGGLMRRKPPARSAWGIDLSAASVKAVKLTCEEGGASVTISACDLVEADTIPVAGANDDAAPAAAGETLAKLISRQPLTADRIVVGMPGMQVLGRFLYLPIADRKKIDAVVRYEVKQQIPFPEAELVWDYHVSYDSGIPVDKDANGDAARAHMVKPKAHLEVDAQPRAILLAVKDKQVRDWLTIFRQAGVTVDIVQSDCLALCNLAIFERLGEGQTIAVADAGREATNVVVISPDLVWFRSVGLGGDDITSALVRELKLTRSSAEHLKRNPSTARRFSQFAQAVRPALADLAREIRLSLASFDKSYPHLTVEHLWGVGGAFRTHGLLRYLRTGQ